MIAPGGCLKELERISGDGSRPRSRRSNAGDAYHGQLVARRSANSPRGKLAEPTFWMKDDAAEISFHFGLFGRLWVTTADAEVFGTSPWQAEFDVASRIFHAALAARSWVTALEPTDADPMVWIADTSGVSPSYHGRLAIRSMSIPDEDEPGGTVFIEREGDLCRSFHGGLLARSFDSTADSGVPSFSAWAEADGVVSTTFHGGLMSRSTDSDHDHSESEGTAYYGDQVRLMRSFHGGLLSRSTHEATRHSVWARLGQALRRLSSSLVPADDRSLPAPNRVAFSRAFPRPTLFALPAPFEVKTAATGRPQDNSVDGSTTESVAGGGLLPVR